MPRQSPFHIELSAMEAAELNRRAVRYTLPYFEVIRARMILMAAQGIDNDEIAARLDAYFSDRGRLFQADRGRRIGAVGDALGKRASSGCNVAQSSTISLKRAVAESVKGVDLGLS